jgi:hypothetical protein
VLRNRSACPGVTPSVISQSRKKADSYVNPPGMIKKPGGPPRAKDTSLPGRLRLIPPRLIPPRLMALLACSCK